MNDEKSIMNNTNKKINFTVVLIKGIQRKITIQTNTKSSNLEGDFYYSIITSFGSYTGGVTITPNGLEFVICEINKEILEKTVVNPDVFFANKVIVSSLLVSFESSKDTS